MMCNLTLPLPLSFLLFSLLAPITPASSSSSSSSFSPSSLSSLSASSSSSSSSPSSSSSSSSYLNLTAITGHNRVSVLECWQLADPFATSDVPGVAGTQTLGLGGGGGGGLAGTTTYTVLPPRFDGGLHNAPAKQYVWFISGLIHLSLPNATEEAWIHGGRYGLIYAGDTADVSGWGHRTRYPGSDETIALVVPVKDGVSPEHRVLHDGPCVAGELAGV
ncbi:hypothetical protein F5X96DRAFT_650019 [Biscogniauxia mediterranea]|nr:hypothetical protein F5X96DRAFT_650019 [Biscogniauxia mediterranea]